MKKGEGWGTLSARGGCEGECEGGKTDERRGGMNEKKKKTKEMRRVTRRKEE